MDGVHKDCWMLFDILQNLIAGHFCKSDTRNALSAAKHFFATLGNQFFERFNQRIGFSGACSSFQSKVAAFIQTGVYARLRLVCGDNSRILRLPAHAASTGPGAAGSSGGGASGGGGGSESHSSPSLM